MKKILTALAAALVCWGARDALAQFDGRAPAPAKPERVSLPSDASPPQWPPPTPMELPPEAPAVRSKNLELVHSREGLGGFVIRVSGKAMAIGQNRPLIGYLAGTDLKWLDLSQASKKQFSVHTQNTSLQVKFDCADPEGANWAINQQFRPGTVPESIEIETSVTIDQDRPVAFLPMLVVFPGAGSFGPTKGQGLLAGLEYIENEPSSSEKDVIGPASKRQVPDSVKLTFPLMVIQNDGRYLALTWQIRPHFSALYDSPDRLFNSGGHVMGLLFPGCNGEDRQEGSLLPRSAQVLHAGVPLTLRATLLGGEGPSVVPAVQQYCALRPMPPVPTGIIGLPQYVLLAGGGWLDSKIREGNLIRHAILGGNFPPGQAADAAIWMDWLAARTTDAAFSAHLHETATNVLAAVPAADLNQSGVGHVRFPIASLLYGHVAENASRASQIARDLLGAFEPDGSHRYHPRPEGPDFAKTHFTNEANGFTSRPVQDSLEAAAFCGDQSLIDSALQKLRAMDKFQNGVPRGAQTWECPLHTPDILASAQMVRAYAVGYELTGDTHLLEQARYWAWTGVPFVYLVSPIEGPVGAYATIAVFGATQWKAPVWLGLPVQWCGLVYADALYRLAPHDPKGPWKKLADGITLSGIQQSWPTTDADTQGLLPDSFVLRKQTRNGPAINPATVQACATRFLNQTPVYDFFCFQKNGVRVHAPGAIQRPQEKKGVVTFDVMPGFDGPLFILVNGLSQQPKVKINGQEVACDAPHEFHAKEGWLILQITGKSRIYLQLAGG